MPCIRCPHCIARGAFGVLDPKDPALTTNQPPKRKRPKGLTSEQWVHRLNKLAAKMDDDCYGVHPSAWAEMTDKDRAEWHRLAKSAPTTGEEG